MSAIGWKNFDTWQLGVPSWEGWKSFNLPNIPGLAMNYDASDLNSIMVQGRNVTQFNDLSGRGNHLTQGSSPNQPRIGMDRSPNGLNLMTFGGGNNSNGDWLKKVGFSNPNIQEFWFVISISDHSSNGGLLGNDADRENIRFDPSNSRQCRYNNDSVIPGAPGDDNDFGAGDGQWNPQGRIGSVLSDLTLPDDELTRVHCTRGNNATEVFNNFVLGGEKVGGGRYLKMKFAQIIATDFKVPAKLSALVSDFLAEKWGVA